MYNKYNYNLGGSNSTETLHKQLLSEGCIEASSGLGAMILDAEEIRRADAGELQEISLRYGR